MDDALVNDAMFGGGLAVTHQASVELAGRGWRLAAIPEFEHECLLDLLLHCQFPLNDLDLGALEYLHEVVLELPAALTAAALADGVSPLDVLHAFADALDPQDP
jgi:hypothetical protein